MIRPMLIRLVLVCFFAGAVFLPSGSCADTDAPDQNNPIAPEGRDAAWKPQGPVMMDAPPVIRKLGPGIFRVGQVTVNKPQALVRVEGQVNMDEGLVEYLACGPDGKLHESLLMLLSQPYNLHVGLLLLGLEGGARSMTVQGAPGVPAGDPVEIWVSWRSGNQAPIRRRAEELLFNSKTRKAMQATHWIFTGSQIVDGRFMAQVEQSVIATYHDPFALLDHPLPTGEDDTVYQVNVHTVPPKGTLVSVEIKAVQKKTAH